jgi:FKBP-type peptidyl-prolyl cis-trans isomerase 2
MAIKKGDVVTVDYEGRLENGEVFDTSYHKDHSHPLTFEVGAKKVIPGFDAAVVGMKKGEEKEVIVQPEHAYGKETRKWCKNFLNLSYQKAKNQNLDTF